MHNIYAWKITWQKYTIINSGYLWLEANNNIQCFTLFIVLFIAQFLYSKFQICSLTLGLVPYKSILGIYCSNKLLRIFSQSYSSLHPQHVAQCLAHNICHNR